MNFIHENFMLQGETAKKLYHNYAKGLPIIDYHCHLSPQMIAENHRFLNITELMLGGDHYKWRVMRAAGIDEKYITGDADDYDKFLKWAQVLPLCIGNPLYHWTHLELKRYFDIDEPLTPKNVDAVWQRCNDLLQREEFYARGLILQSNIEVICTTDDPLDSLEYHQKLKDSFDVKILPAFRPDKAVEIGKETFRPYMQKMGVSTYEDLCIKIKERIAYFHANGCRISDHALEYVPFSTGNGKQAFEKAMCGKPLTRAEEDSYKTEILLLCAGEYTRLGWAMQLHIGALRNNNTPMFHLLGPDTGYDCANDLCIADALVRFLDRLESWDCLPKTILYTLNPKDNPVLSTVLGSFQKAPFYGKLQFGSGWWFNDQKDGMVGQMTSLANVGLLSTFVGMLTDSRSFISYPRHEYFRRILCNLIGGWVDNGEYPCDEEYLSRIIYDICYGNAKRYFGI